MRLFPFCCQVMARCQDSDFGVRIWLCVCKRGSYRKSRIYASAIQMCVSLCTNVYYQGNSPSLNKPFVCFGCSLLWAMLSSRMLSVCSVWIADKSPSSLSPLASIPSITFCVSFLVVICSLFLCLDVAFVFCVLYYAACLI